MSGPRAWPLRSDIHPTAWVAPGAVVVGEVRLGARSSVWFNTVLRGDTERIAIGDETNLQDNSTVHVDEGQPAIVGARVTVGHRAIVHGCVIEDDCLIGMGSVVLSGARIGAGSLLGAASLVREGQVIPPGSLALGSPARVVGPVADAHREAIRRGASHYVALARDYAARGVLSGDPPTAYRGHPMPRESRPMDELEWRERLAALESGPGWIAARLAAAGEARFRRAPAPGRWSALEGVAHLRDCDAEVFAPRLARALAETFPAVDDVPVERWPAERGYAAGSPEAAVAGYRAAREANLATLAPLGPEEWRRPLLHPRRGPHTIADLVRYWSDHDLAHRRQVAAALGAGA